MSPLRSRLRTEPANPPIRASAGISTTAFVRLVHHEKSPAHTRNNPTETTTIPSVTIIGTASPIRHSRPHSNGWLRANTPITPKIPQVAQRLIRAQRLGVPLAPGATEMGEVDSESAAIAVTLPWTVSPIPVVESMQTIAES
jgi:hypothetical protein